MDKSHTSRELPSHSPSQWQNHETSRTKAGMLEEEPEETHWDNGTQTEDEVLEQCLPPKKRPIRIEEESP